MENAKYENFGVNLSKAQIKKLSDAHKKKVGVTIRLTKNNLHGEHKLPLTKTQITRIKKSKTDLDLNVSATQLKHLEKIGGFLPLLALLPLISGGTGAAGAAAGGTAAVVQAVKNVRAQNVAQSEAERHNKTIEEQTALKAGTGIFSDLAGKLPVFGATLKLALQMLGFGIDEINRIKRGECVCKGKGLYMGRVGSGLFLGPKSGFDLFLGPSSG